MALKFQSLEDCLNLRVVLKNGEHGKIIGIKKDKKLLTVKIDNGKSVDRYPENLDIESGKIEIHHPTNGDQRVMISGDEPDETEIRITPPKRYTIQEKFNIMAKLVRMVISREQESVLITGPGGLGKTFTVSQELDAAGLVEGHDYHVIKGYSTAKGLYRVLYEKNGMIIVFDDCDEVLKNDVAKNILKGALDSFDKRVISWNVSNPVDDLPDQFEFTGNVIFISNMAQDKVDQAIRSRSFTIDLSMSAEDKIARMRGILPNVRNDVPIEHRKEVIDFIDEMKDQCNDLNMRTLLKGIKIRKAEPEDWKSMLTFTLLQGE